MLGERDDGGLTEAWLSDEFSDDSDDSFSNGDDESDLENEKIGSEDPADGEFYGGGGKTMAWWRGRQAALRPLPKKKGGNRKGSGSSGSKAKKRAAAASASAVASFSSLPAPVSPPESSEGILSNLRLPWAKKEGGEK